MPTNNQYISVDLNTPISKLQDGGFTGMDKVNTHNNRNLNWVQRGIGNSNLKLINPDNSESTHLLAMGSRNGKYVVFPTVVERKKGHLEKLNPADAYNYAKENDSFMYFDDEKEALDYSMNGLINHKRKYGDGGEVDIDLDKLKSGLIKSEHGGFLKKEGYNPYTTMNSDGAMGKYQFLESVWGEEIKKFAEDNGYRYESPRDFLNNSALQEDFFEHYIQDEIIPQAQIIKKEYGTDEYMDDYQLVSLLHFTGYPKTENIIANKDFNSPQSYGTTANDYLNTAGFGVVGSPIRKQRNQRGVVVPASVRAEAEIQKSRNQPNILVINNQQPVEENNDPLGLKSSIMSELFREYNQNPYQTPNQPQKPNMYNAYLTQQLQNLNQFQEGGEKKKLDDEYNKMTKDGAVEWNGKILQPQVNIETEARPIEQAKYRYYNALVNSKGIGYSPFENMTYSEFNTYLNNNPSMQKEFKEFVASDILRRNPYERDSGADSYLNNLTDEERQYVEGTRVWDRQSKTYKDKIKQGWAEIVDFMSGNPDNLEQVSYLPTSNVPTEGYNENVQRRYNQMSSPNYSSEEKQSASGLDLVDGVFTWSAKPLQYALGQTGLRDYKNPQGEDYSWQDVMSGNQNNATLLEDVATDATNFIPLGLLGKVSKAKNFKHLIKNTPLKNTWKLNPKAIKEPTETMLVRARPVGQNPYINMAKQMEAKQAAGEQLKWYQKMLLNPPSNPDMVAREKYYGQWFADNPSDLDFYINPATRNFADDAKIEILKARIPTTEAAKYRVRNFDDARILSNRPDTEYILPKDMVQRLDRYPIEDLTKLQDEYQKMNTPHWLRGYSKPVFNSEINWSAWNKEIPSNKKLMAEYLDIERKTKANGTWMKNPDGSPFKGTPEQFIQQNSRNFKKAFPNIYREEEKVTPLIHHSRNKFTFFDESKNMSNTGANIGGKGVFTIPKTYYDNYVTHSLDDLAKEDSKAKVLINYGDVRYDLYANTDNLKVFSRGDAFSNTPKTFNTNYRTDPWKAIIPYDKPIKSAVGNNGMFDVSNPNIYKALLPTIPISALLVKER